MNDRATIGEVIRRGPRPGALSTLHKSQRAASRDAILNATNDYLSSRSFEEITIEDIIVRASVSRATFYRHFKSKYEVALALYEQVFGRALPHFDRLADVTNLAAAVSWVEGLAAVYRLEGRASVLILQLGVTDASFHERLRQDRQWLIEHLGQRLPAFARADGDSLDARWHGARADLLLMLLDRICVEIAVHGTLPDYPLYIDLVAQDLIGFLQIGS